MRLLKAKREIERAVFFDKNMPSGGSVCRETKMWARAPMLGAEGAPTSEGYGKHLATNHTHRRVEAIWAEIYQVGGLFMRDIGNDTQWGKINSRGAAEGECGHKTGIEGELEISAYR